MSLILPHEMKKTEKPWGFEIEIYNGDLYCGKKLFIRAREFCSYHYHEIKDEVLLLESGQIKMIHDNDGGGALSCVPMTIGDAFRVVPKMRHQMLAIEDAWITEFSTHL